MNTNIVYKKNSNCLIEDMDGELLVYDPESATTLHLNNSSMIVLELCDGKRSLTEIIRLVQEAYPGQSEEVEADILALVEDLTSRQVLQAIYP